MLFQTKNVVVYSKIYSILKKSWQAIWLNIGEQTDFIISSINLSILGLAIPLKAFQFVLINRFTTPFMRVAVFRYLNSTAICEASKLVEVLVIVKWSLPSRCSILTFITNVNSMFSIDNLQKIGFNFNINQNNSNKLRMSSNLCLKWRSLMLILNFLYLSLIEICNVPMFMIPLPFVWMWIKCTCKSDFVFIQIFNLGNEIFKWISDSGRSGRKPLIKLIFLIKMTFSIYQHFSFINKYLISSTTPFTNP